MNIYTALKYNSIYLSLKNKYILNTTFWRWLPLQFTHSWSWNLCFSLDNITCVQELQQLSYECFLWVFQRLEWVDHETNTLLFKYPLKKKMSCQMHLAILQAMNITIFGDNVTCYWLSHHVETTCLNWFQVSLFEETKIH